MKNCTAQNGTMTDALWEVTKHGFTLRDGYSLKFHKSVLYT